MSSTSITNEPIVLPCKSCASTFIMPFPAACITTLCVSFVSSKLPCQSKGVVIPIFGVTASLSICSGCKTSCIPPVVPYKSLPFKKSPHLAFKKSP